MTEQATDLLPCPFCGQAPNPAVKSGGGDERYGYNFKVEISCACGVSISRRSHQDKLGWCDDSGQAKTEVIAAWNRRADPLERINRLSDGETK